MKLKLCSFLSLLFISIVWLRAQDYQISFAGSGAATAVSKVLIENLTQVKSITINGSDVLHLMGTISGIETVNGDETNKIVFYPNPMNDFTKMKFVLPVSGENVISLYDISGREIVRKKDLLSIGQHIYEIHGIREGIYFARIISGRYSLNGRLISDGSHSDNTKIEYAGLGETKNLTVSKGRESDSKGSKAEVIMQYNTGDRLKYTAITGNYRSVFTDIPATDNNIVTFNFTACSDGNSYNNPTVHIGTQLWMAENLKTTKYNDGTDIPNVKDGKDWESLTTPAYCWFNNDVANKDIYGALYNWHTVATGKLCPAGWHIPTDDEWKALVDFLNYNGYKCEGIYGLGPSIAKSLAATTNWTESPRAGSVGNTDFPDKRNATGFTALPGSNRYSAPGGVFGGVDGTLGDYANWWSATEVINTTKAKGRSMLRSDCALISWEFEKTHGFSVRCLKNQSAP